ncbi:MAG: hypothetical protein GKR91_19405 [Pseudomonadales bacterium]|nr:hypothetical protein [Pseudomonadales bacterium]
MDANRNPQVSKKFSTSELSSAKAALIRQIEIKSEEDPLIGAKIYSKEILNRTTHALKREGALHTESLICALGSLAGYSCQSTIRQILTDKGQDPDAGFIKMKGADGKTYFYGDHINAFLLENKISIWSLAAAACKDSGGKNLIDIGELAAHVAGTIGKTEFGIPRIEEGHETSHTPIEYVKQMWSQMLGDMSEFCPNPQHWPIACGLALQQGIKMCKDTLDSELALSIAMESAVPMSKIDIDAY